MRTIAFIGKRSSVSGGAEQYFSTLFSDFNEHLASSPQNHDIQVLFFDRLPFIALCQLFFKPSQVTFIFNISILFQFSPLHIILFLLSKQVILIPHVVASPYTTNARYKHVRYFIRLINALLCTRLVCISLGNYSLLSSFPFLNESKLFLLRNYTETSWIRSFSEIYNFDFSLAIVGRLQNCHKGQFDFLTENNSFIKTSRLSVHFIGDGPDYQLLQDYIFSNSLSSLVYLHGFKPKTQVYSCASFSVVVCYSYWEGLPLNLLEAYAAGKIVVGRDIPGVSEIVFPYFRFSDNTQFHSILSGLQDYISSPDFQQSYSAFVSDILSTYNKEIAMSRLIELTK